MKKLVSTLLCIIGYFLGYSQIITTVVGNGYGAGTGSGGFSGDGGLAANAEMRALSDVSLDDSGNIFIVDMGNQRVREVRASNGIITTVAGGGHSYYGSAATSVFLSLPVSVAVDDSGNIFIVDQDFANVGEVIKSTGIMKAFAGVPGSGNNGYWGDGGPASWAGLNHPCSVRLDDSDNVYIADFSNNRIREVAASTGIINTIAGNGATGYSGDGGLAANAEIYSPSGVAIDDSGNVYLGDDYNNVIRKIYHSSGIINTIAGNYALGIGFSGDGGPATLAEISANDVNVDKLGNIYIADGYYKIRFVSVSSGIISTIAGCSVYGYSGDGGPATLAELNATADMVFDKNGNMYIADDVNNVVREVTPAVSTGIEKNDNINMASVFPNPANNEIIIQFVGTQNFVSTIQFYDITGREVINQKLTKATTTIDCSGLSEGVYLYSVASESGSVIGQGKVVVER